MHQEICRLNKIGKVLDRVSSFVPITINKCQIKGLSDSGNNMTDNAMSFETFKRLNFSAKDLDMTETPEFAGTAAQQGKIEIVGRFKKEISINIGACPVKFKTKPFVLAQLSHDFNISRNFMKINEIIEDHPRQALRHKNSLIPLGSKCEERVTAISRCYVDEPVTVKQGDITTITVTVPGHPTTPTQIGTIHPDQTFFLKTGCLPAALPIEAKSITGDTKYQVPIFNAGHTTLTVPKGVRYGQFVPLTMNEINAINDENNNAHSDSKEEQAKQIEQAFKLKENPHLDTDKKQQLVQQLLLEFYDVFSWNGEFGRTHLVQHAIKLKPGATPVACKTRVVPPHLEPGLYKCLLKWWDNGLIEECESEWNSPIVIANKKVPAGAEPEKRYCIDSRLLNKQCLKDNYYIGNIHDNLSRLNGAAIFSTLDSVGAYHSIPLKPEDKHKTAFSTPYGTFCFTRLCFGLTNGPSQYARLMRLVLAGVPKSKALPFLDDVLVHSPDNFHEHLSNLRDVFTAHKKAGLKLKPSKCHLFKDEVEYLGHTVSKNGVAPLRTLTEAIREWPMPTNRAETRTLLGKLSYYRHFVRNFSRKAAPLLDVLRQDGTSDTKQLVLTKEFKTAATSLKNEVASAPIMGHPDFSRDAKPFIVDTDFSQNNRAIGGVLSQEQSNKERVIQFGAKRLTKSQAKYSPFQGELAAVLHFLKSWKYYLLGKKFVIRVDNTGLLALSTLEPPDGMIARWLQTLSNFDFSIVHRSSKAHGNADHLSRAPHVDPPDGSTEDVEEECEHGILAITSHPNKWVHRLGPRVTPHLQTILPAGEKWTDDDWIERQENDTVLAQIKTMVIDREEPTRQTIQASCPETQRYLSLFKDLRIDGRGILCYQRTIISETGKETKLQVYVVPKLWQQEAMIKCHEAAGHARDEEVIRRAQKFIYFNGMHSLATKVRQECPDCQTKTGQLKPQHHTLKSVITGFPFQALAVDFVGPLPISRKGNNRYLLTILCRFTKYLSAYPVKRADGETVLQVLENFISHFGLPETIHSDNGSHFKTHPVQWAAQELGIRWNFTPPYHPQSNPVERYHRTLTTMLKAVGKGDQHSWQQNLPTCLFQMRTMKSRATGYTPYRMVFGREASMPLQMLYGVPKPENYNYRNHSEYLTAMTERMAAVHEYARKNLRAAVERQRKLYYQKRERFHVGDQVWLFTPTRPLRVPSKLYSRYWTGPWSVEKCINEVVYKLRPCSTWFTKRSQVVSIDRMKVYHQQEVDRQGNQLNLPPAVDADLQMPGDECCESLSTHEDDSDGEADQPDRQPDQIRNDNEQELPPAPPIEPQPALPQNPEIPQQAAGQARAERLRAEAERLFGGELPAKRLRRDPGNKN